MDSFKVLKLPHQSRLPEVCERWILNIGVIADISANISGLVDVEISDRVPRQADMGSEDSHWLERKSKNSSKAVFNFNHFNLLNRLHIYQIVSFHH